MASTANVDTITNLAGTGSPDFSKGVSASGQPCMSAYVSGSPTGPNNSTVVPVIFDTVDFDQGSNYNNVTGLFTAPVAGKYLVTASVDIDSIPNNANSIMYVFKNGTAVGNRFRVIDNKYTPTASTAWARVGLSGSMIISLAANDTIAIGVRTDIAGATTIANNFGNGNSFAVTRVA